MDKSPKLPPTPPTPLSLEKNQHEGHTVGTPNQLENSSWLRLVGRPAHIVGTLAFIFALCVVCVRWHNPMMEALLPYALAVVLFVGGFTLISHLCVIAFFSARKCGKIWRRLFGS
jgi:hypothetical protein